MKSITVSELKNVASIEEIIGNYLNIKKAGTNYKALCPFHQEKTPSFIINPEKKFYHCFGCGEHGDVFSFIIKYKNKSFKEAVKEVADYYGYEIKSEYFKYNNKSNTDLLIKINNIALQEYRNLLKNQELGRIAREYLNKRKIKDNIIEIFGLGYAPDKWDTITNLLKKTNIDEKIIEKTDLIKYNKEHNKKYDRFRHRIIFPIYNLNDEVLGFGGRTLGQGKTTGNEPVKYINSSENEIFKKRTLLYNLNLAKNEIKQTKTAIITEGYLDVIACYQFGFKNVVAPMGTALTIDQLRKLENIAERVILLFDGDKAGFRAVIKNIDIVLQTKMDVEVTTLPNDYDPYDYLFEYGKEGLERLIEDSENGLDFKIKYLSKSYDMSSPKGKENFIKHALYFINRTGNRILYDIALKKISQISQISENTIRKEFTKKNKKEIYKKQESIQQIKESTENKFQKIILCILLANPNEVEDYIVKLPENIFKNDFYKKVFEIIKDMIIKEEYLNINIIYDYLADEEKNLYQKLSQSINEYKADSTTIEQMLNETINNLRIINIEKRIKENDVNTKQASEAGNLVLLSHYMEERQYLLNERAKLNKLKYHMNGD